jgi:predicted nucleic acid-binding protein
MGPAPDADAASVIHLDTSVLVDALTGPRRSAPALRGVLDQGERIGIATLVLYEWLRGPRREAELLHQEALLPAAEALPFGLERQPWPPSCIGWCRARGSASSTSAWRPALVLAARRSGR